MLIWKLIQRLGQRFASVSTVRPSQGMETQSQNSVNKGSAPTVLDQQRANLENLFREAPELVCVLSGPEHLFEFVNQAHVEILGFDATGKTVRQAQPESIEVHGILDDVYRTGVTANLREIPVTIGSRIRYFNLTYAPRKNSRGEIDGIMILGHEVTDQILFRDSAHLQQQALELALQDAPLKTILTTLIQMVEVQTGHELLGSILVVDPTGQFLNHGAAPSLPPEYNEAISQIQIGESVGSCGTAAYFSEKIIVEDIENDSRWADYKNLALKHGLRACWSTPIMTAQGKLLGTFAFYAKTCRGPTAREEQIIDIASRTTALIMARRLEIDERLANAKALLDSEAERNLTLQRLTQNEALLAAEKFNLDQIIQTSPAAMATWVGPKFIFDRVNPQYSKIFGHRPLVGRELLEACPELKGQGFEDLIRKVLETGEPVIGIEALAKIASYPGGPTKDHYYDFQYIRINDPSGQPYGVFDFAIDVTERVVAQKQANEATSKLRQAERLLKRAIQVANIGFYDWNVTANLISFSDQMKADWGIAADTSLEDVLSFIHDEDRERVELAVQETVIKGNKYSQQYRVLRPTDQKIIWIEAQGEVVRDEDSGQQHFIGTSLDITDRKKTESALTTATSEAQKASIAKSAFLANMSHEIRTPLGAIMGFAEMLRTGELGKSDATSFAAVIERNSQHLLRIVDDILDLSKVEAGKMLFEKIEFSLPDLLSDFSSLMGFRARDKGIDFALRFETVIPDLVVSDPTRLRQILNNVVGNAIKFTDKGRVQLSVTFLDGQLSFTVSDTGSGISKQAQEKLFQPFHQEDASTTRRFGGTGLGLVLTRKLSESMGGAFQLVDSKVGIGSVFTASVKVNLPVRHKMIEQTKSDSASTAVLRSSGGAIENLRVLVVEDSPDNQVLFRLILNRAGAKIDIASDGYDGMNMALTNEYDVVLMDMQMPRMDGYEATKSLREKGFQLPIIALTAHAMKEEREKAIRSGFTDFLTKPVQRETLIEMLQKHSGR